MRRGEECVYRLTFGCDFEIEIGGERGGVKGLGKRRAREKYLNAQQKEGGAVLLAKGEWKD